VLLETSGDHTHKAGVLLVKTLSMLFNDVKRSSGAQIRTLGRALATVYFVFDVNEIAVVG
jgi:hypothetical protein